MLGSAQIGNIVILVQSMRSDWAIQSIRPVIEDLANADHDAKVITAAAMEAASDRMYRYPTSIYRVLEDMLAEGRTGSPKQPDRGPECDICGRTEKMHYKAIENQLKIFNEARARHPELTGPIKDDPRHEFKTREQADQEILTGQELKDRTAEIRSGLEMIMSSHSVNEALKRPPGATITEQDQVTTESLRRRPPRTDRIPYVPEDLLGDAVAGRATADDQETGESTP